MNIEFKKMSSDELCEYVESFDFQTYRDVDPRKLDWMYIQDCLIEEINIPDMQNKHDWVSWINQEQEMFIEDMSYDRYAEVEEYWIQNPYEEPVIMIRYLDGINDIADGWHRTGLACRNNLNSIPVILGVEKHL